MVGEQAGVGHVGQARPLRFGAGKAERTAGFAADGGVGGECDAHVHRIADGIADDGVRAVDGPAEAVAVGGGEDFVFLGVIEVLDVEPALFLAEGRGRELALSIRFERAEVMFEACHQGHVLDGAGGAERVEQVADHGAVDPDVLGFGGLAEPAGEEDVGGSLRFEGLGESGGVEEVGGDRVQALDIGAGAAGEAADRPAAAEEVTGQVVADDAGRAGDERGSRHGVLLASVRGT